MSRPLNKNYTLDIFTVEILYCGKTINASDNVQVQKYYLIATQTDLQLPMILKNKIKIIRVFRSNKTMFKS